MYIYVASSAIKTDSRQAIHLIPSFQRIRHEMTVDYFNLQPGDEFAMEDRNMHSKLIGENLGGNRWMD